MNTDKDGGNAFPIPGLQDDPDFNGLSVRDYFAAKASTVIKPPTDYMGRAETDEEYAAWAQKCWRMADSLLAARGAK
ncbi:hypothetical protein LMG3458_02054 [Achromobacter deleyi]|uniref:Uncharacterized protein n=1 Tax=Achromobacter deleyi TaxID=1353891 RepID=A0A6S7AGX7_9BURK|nr:hypothetical protein [Achromobacter deleyi]CAB3689464.1 hypothetical protein LMG3458_02054 [Achromobacter deleyi]